ncbi:S24 family peptidase [Flexibacterium corallicola]|uniref:S24 family peptidase n=1 Tax=Flexibacterium corallicola TaxID=3037259 RepID=UPI00286EC425|nr:S24 family peptidase [Pseudovibrio sp. M1P-2-3]
MLSHKNLWQAIDHLAKLEGISLSALAKKAGLDPTAFNKSKRMTTQGQLHWPSTQSISKLLDVTGKSFSDFAKLVEGNPAESSPSAETALLSLTNSNQDLSLPISKQAKMHFPSQYGEKTVALEVYGNIFEPLFRDGDTVIVAPNAPLRRMDTVIYSQGGHRAKACYFLRKTVSSYEFRCESNQASVDVLAHNEVKWIARVLWVSRS